MNAPQTHPAHLSAAICRNPGCGKEFRPRRQWQRFCSAACRRTFHAAGTRLDNLERRVIELERLVAGLTGRAPMPVRGDGA